MRSFIVFCVAGFVCRRSVLMLAMSQHYPFFISLSIFSNVYIYNAIPILTASMVSVLASSVVYCGFEPRSRT
jgi:hypothetical protein